MLHHWLLVKKYVFLVYGRFCKIERVMYLNLWSWTAEDKRLKWRQKALTGFRITNICSANNLYWISTGHSLQKPFAAALISPICFTWWQSQRVLNALEIHVADCGPSVLQPVCATTSSSSINVFSPWSNPANTFVFT